MPRTSPYSGVVLQVAGGTTPPPQKNEFRYFFGLCIVFYMNMNFILLSPNCDLPYSNSALSALFCVQFFLLADCLSRCHL